VLRDPPWLNVSEIEGESVPFHLHVDLEVCQGHGLCFFVSEDLFDLRDPDGKAIVRLDPVPEHLVDVARESIDACPEQAITLTAD
jgi:ferredoxin